MTNYMHAPPHYYLLNADPDLDLITFRRFAGVGEGESHFSEHLAVRRSQKRFWLEVNRRPSNLAPSLLFRMLSVTICVGEVRWKPSDHCLSIIRSIDKLVI
jgi:hypothetical protein